PQIRLPRAPEEEVAEPAADERADETRADGDPAERRRAVLHAAHALEKGRHPVGKTAERERVGAVPERREDELFVAEQIAIRVENRHSCLSLFERSILQPSRWILHRDEE